MSRHDPLVTLRQMRDYAAEGVAMVKGRTADEMQGTFVLLVVLVLAGHVAERRGYSR